MNIGGLQKTTLIDFPGRIACTVFTIGCNFRCPFCHNKDLVTLDNFRKSRLLKISEQSFFEFLDKRKKILDGVCITGGEPTLQPDLTEFCKKIKRLGLEVKLDTNGSNPEVLEKLIKKKLVDFIAMDIKTTFENYPKVVNFQFPPASPPDLASTRSRTGRLSRGRAISNFQKSIYLILHSNLDYEFRTTIVPGLHNEENLMELAKDLNNLAKSVNHKSRAINYFLQLFRAQNCLDSNYLKVKPFSDKETKTMLKAVKRILPNTKLRGEN